MNRMQLMSPTDSMFLIAESREHPMHVGGLALYEPPEDAGPEFVRELYEEMVTHTDFQPVFRKHPATLLGGIANVGWTVDNEVDLDYHLRRSALPSPGRPRELLELASRVHGTLLDRHRPLWEAYLIEGMADGRFAVYTKVHHSLIDGVSAMKLVERTLSGDPNDTTVRVPWNLPRRESSRGQASGQGAGQRGPSSLVRTATGAATSLAALAPSTLRLARSALLEQQLTLPFGAPKTMFNVKIGGARRVAAQSWPLERLRRIKAVTGATINDIVLAMCAGALRAYLAEQDALPDRPLIAMVPVSLRSEHQADAGGNMVGSILCSLGTDVEDPADRLAVIRRSITDNKKVFSELPRLQALALSALLIAPLGLTTAFPGFVGATAPPFNVVISNVPGPKKPLYWRGARLAGNYPLSVALDGQALNMTVVSNAHNLDFGLVGCRRSVPHLQRLLGHLETSLKDLETASGA